MRFDWWSYFLIPQSSLWLSLSSSYPLCRFQTSSVFDSSQSFFVILRHSSDTKLSWISSVKKINFVSVNLQIEIISTNLSIRAQERRVKDGVQPLASRVQYFLFFKKNWDVLDTPWRPRFFSFFDIFDFFEFFFETFSVFYILFLLLFWCFLC